MPLIFCSPQQKENYKMVNLVTANRLNDPFYVSTLGLTANEAEVFYPEGWTKYLLLFSARGCGTVFLNEKAQLLEPGSAVLFSPNQCLHYLPTSHESWRTYWITFNGKSCASLLNLPNAVQRKKT
jgi:hypothetical protein